jgi:murein DD-endopeptidase MepM/ murein hydrolase activator NlpD
MQQKYKMLSFFLLLTVLSFGLNSLILAQDNSTPSNDSNKKSVYLPFVSSSSTGKDAQVADSGISEWQVYDVPQKGISLEYPMGWKVSVPDLPSLGVVPSDLPKEYTHGVNQDYAQTLGYSIMLYASDNEKSRMSVEVNLESYTISPGVSLSDWVTLLFTLHKIENPLTVNTKLSEVTSSPDSSGQMLRTIVSTDENYIETLWLTKGEFVYSIRSYTADSQLTEIVEQIVKRIRFGDEENYQLLRKSIPFAGNEEFLKQQIEKLKPVPPPECDIRCQDQKAYEGLPTDSVTVTFEPLQASAVSAVTVSANRKALPANWLTPVYPPAGTTSYPVECGSQFHTNAAEFAVDAGTPIGTPVYAAFDGYVERSDLDTTGYGNLVLLRTSINIAAESRTYYHVYAHLNARNVSVGATVGRGALLGWSGNTTGNQTTVGAHLHFHIRDANFYPVDASPVLGFTPNLSYPSSSATCGRIEKYDVAPVIIEPVAFTERYQPRNNRYWFCLNSISGATNECYLEATPNNGMNLDPLTPSQSPELRYNNVYLIPPQNPTTYYVWVCGRGDNGSNDSLHMGAGGSNISTLANIDGYNSASWVWRSQRSTNFRPTVSAGLGQNVFNVWMREDGMRIARILMTTNPNYNPTGNIRCGAY